MKQSILGNLKKGIVFLLSGPAGVGKTTLALKLMEEFDSIKKCITYTTRPIRNGEKEDVDYHFISEKEFQKRAKKGSFAETTTNYGYHYGTDKKDLLSLIDEGKHVFLIVDTRGAKKLKKQLKVVSIFLMPPSKKELINRLKKRSSESSEAIEIRIKNAKKELKDSFWYDYRFVNGDLDTSYDTIRAIVIAEEYRLLNKNKKGDLWL